MVIASPGAAMRLIEAGAGALLVKVSRVGGIFLPPKQAASEIIPTATRIRRVVRIISSFRVCNRGASLGRGRPRRRHCEAVAELAEAVGEVTQVADQAVGLGQGRLGQILDAGPRIGDHCIEIVGRTLGRGDGLAQILRRRATLFIDQTIGRVGENPNLLRRDPGIARGDPRICDGVGEVGRALGEYGGGLVDILENVGNVLVLCR